LSPRQTAAWIAGRAAQIHDDLNLALLLGMSIVAAYAMAVHNRELQYQLTVFAVGYMCLDALWICFNMDSVKSPKTVLGHHIATLAVLADPLLQRQHGFYTCCALLVEVNTFLLIVRRRVSWGSSLAVELPFVLSWVTLRLIWYPFLAVYWLMCAFPGVFVPLYPAVLVRWRERVEGHAVPMFKGSYVAWVGICLFQGWWSMALFRTYNKKKSSKYL
jgi:TLC domain